MVYFKFEKITLTQIINKIEKTANSLNQSVGDITSNTKEDTITHHTPEGIRIPVFYDTDQQWDLADVAAQCQLSIEEVIQKHSTKTYQSYAHGFTPGFCYLASLSHTIRVPRKASPRLKVPQGAVAIAEEQTAVYPNESPGGWNIIGQTPLAMYTRDRHDFSPLIALGDRISFYSISKEEFNNIKAAESLKKMKSRGAS